MHIITVDTFDEWRIAARTLLQAHIAPELVTWQSPDQQSLFTDNCAELRLQGNPSFSQSPAEPISVPKQFIAQLRRAACYIDAAEPTQKWFLFYSLLWRITKVDRRTLSLKSDGQVLRLQHMLKSVNRDKHKMKAFLRFKKASTQASGEQDYYTAWFEPEHAIIEAIAPFFVQRFTGMHWSILTPFGCAHWNQNQLSLSQGVPKPHIETDHYETFWKTYYRNIFNPARLKLNAMQSEMPKKYWKYLPEAVCIKDLSRQSSVSTQAMLQNESSDAQRLRKRSKSISRIQDEWRAINRK